MQRVREFIAHVSANHQQPINALFGDPLGDDWIIFFTHLAPIRAKFRAAARNPAMHARPFHFLNIIRNETAHRVAHREHHVSLIESMPHRRAHRRIHSRRGSVTVHDGEPKLTLSFFRRKRLRAQQRV